MEPIDVRNVAASGTYDGTPLRGKIEETHISWVILTKHLAFKIKKPVKLSFLNFSTPDLRKTFCEKELMLNRRFSDIYLAVLPIRKLGSQWVIGGPEDTSVIDYCVVMKRLATAKRMDNMIRNGTARENSIKTLAAQVAVFHSKADKVFDAPDITKMQSLFNDIVCIPESASTGIAPPFHAIIRQAIHASDRFLGKNIGRIQQRIDHGLKRDIHGDLHCGNIFLYRKPVVFDCIEFNDVFRCIDVLYEVAFLCMDLEALHKKHLSDIFVTEYKKHFAAFQQKEDYSLFIYFKALRANIRAKVHAMQARQSIDPSSAVHQARETARYLTLMSEYLADLRAISD